MEKQETSIIYGKNAVTETLTSGREIDTVYVQKGASLGKILALAKKSGAVVKEVGDEKLTAMCGTPKHGGTAAELASASYSTVEDILAAAEEKGKPPFIIIADEYQKLRAEGAAKFPDLRKLALADDSGCFVGFALLDNARKLLRSGGLSKLREFVHRAFGVVFSGVRTDEYRPCEMFFFHNYSLLKTLVTAE